MLAAALGQAVRRYLHNVEESGIPVCFGVAFRSQAEGRADPWSDIDFITNPPHPGRGGGGGGGAKEPKSRPNGRSRR